MESNTISSYESSAPHSVLETLRAVGEIFEISVAFDADISDRQQPISLEDVSVTEALDRIAKTSEMIWAVTGETSIVVAEDTPNKRRTYEPMAARTFYLEHADGKTVLTVLRALVGMKHVAYDEALNAITVRTEERVLPVIERLLSNHDRSPALVEVAVRVIAIDRPDKRWLQALGLSDETDDLPVVLDDPQVRRLLELDGVRSVFSSQLVTPEREVAKISSEGAVAPGSRVEIRAHTDVKQVGDGEPRIELDLSFSLRSTVDESEPVGLGSYKLSSTVSLSPGQSFIATGLPLQRGDRHRDPAILIATPRVLSPSTVTSMNSLPFAVGTEIRIHIP